MRRASTCLVALGLLVVFAVSSVASAAPPVKFKAKAVPIPKEHGGVWPHTGNIKGAGAAFQSEFTIERKSPTEGEEYGGYQPPLMAVNVKLPKGVKLNTSAFKKCSVETLKVAKEPSKCPKGSSAGPLGHALGFVVIGGEHVEEHVTIQSFFTSEGLAFYVKGESPTLIEIVSTGKFVNLGGGGGFGPEFRGNVPLIESLPEAPFGSTETINVKVGAAVKKGKKTIYYGTVPHTCPKGGFPVKAELVFANPADLPNEVAGEKTIAEAKAPCPPR
jgi:hypothetical protein